MIRSMTAYGRATLAAPPDQASGKNITVELKSVNNRYLDCTVRASRGYGFLEDRVRQYVQSCGISRGKLDVSIGVESVGNGVTSIGLDRALAGAYIDALRALRDEFGLKDDISVMTVAANRDLFVTVKPEEDAEKDWEMIKPVLDEAVSAFLKVREAEGERLRADIVLKMERIELLAGEIKKLSEEDAAAYRSKFEAKLKKLISDSGVEPDTSLVLTECAIYADRAAIDEEIVRLSCHFGAFREILAADEPVGRKLDFLLQEINRETNTIGSKSASVGIASLVVEIKSELEKIREQIQNIE